jgi:hypothetical protein
MLYILHIYIVAIIYIYYGESSVVEHYGEALPGYGEA